MAQLYINFLRLALWLAILVVIFVPLEYFFAVQSHKRFRKDLGADLFYYFLNSLLPAAILSVPAAILGWTAQHALPDEFLDFTGNLPFWLRAFLAAVAGEVGYYWGHRWSHEVPFLWRFHSVHHSAEEVDFLVNTRGHPLDMVFGRTCSLIPIYVLGLGGPTSATGGSLIPILVTLGGTVWGFFIHANLKWNLGPFEWIVSTPKFHHWHHTKHGLIDHNYASTFPWLDRIFGTHNLPKEWPASYGIDAEMPPGVLDQLIYPLKREPAPEAVQPVQPTEENS
jgi:sterol desaturase/sphingolipid hydroxylase (fatty acid hydroxylase superfamily)